MIISSEFSVDMVAFYHVEECAFLVVVKDLHHVVYGAKGVCLFHKVLSESAQTKHHQTRPAKVKWIPWTFTQCHPYSYRTSTDRC